jgi:uracil-DNA glycosylase
MMPDIMIVGEAYGEKEEEQGKPFVGTSGWLLDQMLAQAGIDRRECYLTNVFNFRPKPSNDIKNVCGPKADALPGYPALQKSKFVRKEYAGELDRLYREIGREAPNVILALGATAVWALCLTTGIKAVRGSTTLLHPTVAGSVGLNRPVKVLPTYHPAAVARQWTLRPIVIADLDKAKRESASAEYTRPSRRIWIKPTLEDLQAFEELHVRSAERLAPDIETKQDQITCIGFATDAHNAIVIPFFTESGLSYWPTVAEEVAAWNYVRRWLALKPSVFQNGLYDINFLWSRYGIPVPLAGEDTMLLHHAWQPEMEKGLGFLATIYTDEASWKFMIKGTKKHD